MENLNLNGFKDLKPLHMKFSNNMLTGTISRASNGEYEYTVNSYDIKGKQHLKSLEKYYIVDIGLRKLLINIAITVKTNTIQSLDSMIFFLFIGYEKSKIGRFPEYSSMISFEYITAANTQNTVIFKTPYKGIRFSYPEKIFISASFVSNIGAYAKRYRKPNIITAIISAEIA